MKVIAGVVLAGALSGAGAWLMSPGSSGVLAAQPASPAGGTQVIPEAFVAGMGDFAQDGPALSALVPWHSAQFRSPQGDVFVLDPVHQQIFAYIRKEGRVYTVTAGAPGHRDGPAGQAQVGLNLQDNIFPAGVFDAKGRFLFTDFKSGTLRAIERKDDGRWQFTTVLGAGARPVGKIAAGESVPAKDVGKMDSLNGMCSAPDGTIYLGLGWGAGILALKDGAVTRLKLDASIKRPALVADDAGNLYCLDGRDCYYKIDKDGRVILLGGAAKGETGRDGPALQATYWCPATLGVAPDGSALYVGAGDERTLRKISPISPEGRVSTLMRDGTWKECQRHLEAGQWDRPPGVSPRTGQATMSIFCPWELGQFQHRYSGAWINRLEGADVDLMRKALGVKEGGAK